MFGEFRPIISIIKKADKTGEVVNNMTKLQSRELMVGIPEEKSSRVGGEITNAELAYIHENGSPQHNIPIREFLGPTIRKHREAINSFQRRILKAALDGDLQKAYQLQEQLGLYVQAQVKNYFVDPANGWPPNSPRTIARKKSDRPLIDTAKLRNNITYVIRRK